MRGHMEQMEPVGNVPLRRSKSWASPKALTKPSPSRCGAEGRGGLRLNVGALRRWVAWAAVGRLASAAWLGNFDVVAEAQAWDA